MAPKGRVGKKRPVRKTRGKRISVRAKPTKDQVKAAEEEETAAAAVEVVKFVCSTPKGSEYRIPKMETCPPAPTKRRLTGSVDGCSLRRAEGLFDHPDIELFFKFAGNGPST